MSTLTRFGRAAAAALFVVTVPVGSVMASTPGPGSDPLPPVLSGSAAIAALGPHLADVASEHGLSARDLAGQLTGDRRLLVDRNRNLLFSEPVVPAGADVAAASTTLGTYAGTVPVTGLSATQVFTLASRPGAPVTVYLDFDGHVTTGTAWNSSLSIPTITTVSATSSPGTFTQGDLDAIAATWSIVAEDFAAFDVNVTTQLPAADLLVRSSPADTQFGIRVVVGPNSFYPASAGGVAYVGSILWDVETPAFVFTSFLTSNAKNVAEAASHEVGHTFGLLHDGNSTSSYYSGHNGWAPIMGVGYYQSLTQWSSGEYSGANNLEDDVDTIASVAGRAGDPEGSPASPYAAGAVPATVAGVVSSRDDVDAFTVSTPGGLRVSLRSRSVQSDLDAKVTVLSSTGQTVASADPSGAGPVSLYAALPSGSYQVQVDGVGAGDLLTGYSDYASLGGYTVSVTGGAAPSIVSATSTPVTSGIRFDASATDTDGDTLSYLWSFSDGAPSMAGASVTRSVSGSIAATVTVTDVSGLAASTTFAVVVTGNLPPVVKASASPTTITVGSTVTFSAAGSYDPEGGTLSYRWVFSDTATSSTAVSVARTPSTAGTVTATVIVTDPFGLVTQADVSVTVTSLDSGGPQNTAPVAAASVSAASGAAPFTVTFSSAGSSDPDGDTLSYQWLFSDSAQVFTTSTVTRTFSTAGTVIASLVVTDPYGATASASKSVQVWPALSSTTTIGTPLGFSSLTPARLADSRSSIGVTQLPASSFRRLQVTGRGGVPASARAVAVNVTTLSPSAAGYLTVYGCGTRPSVASFNWAAAGETSGNAQIVPLDATGGLCLFSSAVTHVVVDVTAYFASTSTGRFNPVAPVRVADSRSALGIPTRLSAGQTVTLKVGGVASVSAAATAVAVTVTSTGAAAAGQLRVFACGTYLPSTWTLSMRTNQTRSNNAVVRLGAAGTTSAGKLCIYSPVATHIIVDVSGWFGSTGLRYQPVAPLRVLDTRSPVPELSAGRVGVPVTAGSSVRLSASGLRGIPSGSAVSVNVTALGHTSGGYVLAYPDGMAMPSASTLNHGAADVVSDGAQVRTASSRLKVFTSVTGHLLVDVLGVWLT